MQEAAEKKFKLAFYLFFPPFKDPSRNGCKRFLWLMTQGGKLDPGNEFAEVFDV